MKPNSTLWDRAVLKTIAIRDRLAVEKDAKKRKYLKRRLAGSKEWEAALESQFLDAVRKSEKEPNS